MYNQIFKGSLSNVFKNKNEKILSEVINSNYAVIYFKPDGTVIKANEVFLKTMGYSLEEVVGKHHSMFCEEKFTKRTFDY